MNNNNDEFRPNVIEPIEGQMRYDEILVPQKEEPKEEPVEKIEGQMDMFELTKNDKK